MGDRGGHAARGVMGRHVCGLLLAAVRARGRDGCLTQRPTTPTCRTLLCNMRWRGWSLFVRRRPHVLVTARCHDPTPCLRTCAPPEFAPDTKPRSLAAADHTKCKATQASENDALYQPYRSKLVGHLSTCRKTYRLAHSQARRSHNIIVRRPGSGGWAFSRNSAELCGPNQCTRARALKISHIALSLTLPCGLGGPGAFPFA